MYLAIVEYWNVIQFLDIYRFKFQWINFWNWHNFCTWNFWIWPQRFQTIWYYSWYECKKALSNGVIDEICIRKSLFFSFYIIHSWHYRKSSIYEIKSEKWVYICFFNAVAYLRGLKIISISIPHSSLFLTIWRRNLCLKIFQLPNFHYRHSPLWKLKKACIFFFL